jgi:hypothetical protein
MTFRGRDADEDLPVVYFDDEGRRADRAVVELRHRRPWKELLLVVTGIAAVLGIGLLGDGDRDGDETAADRTTTTTHTTASRQRARSTTTGTYVATTTSLPRHDPGAGPLLPGPTATFLAFTNGTGLVTVVDLDTGDQCVNRPPGQGAWLPFVARSIDGRALLQTTTGVATIDATCSVRSIGEGANAFTAAVTDEAVWLLANDGTELVEVTADDRVRGRVELPAGAGPTIVAAGRRLVLNVAGSMTLVDPASDGRRDLGAGSPIAAVGDTLAYVACPELRCSIVLLDLDTGRRRSIAVGAVAPLPYGPAAFSPDGRLLMVAVAGAPGRNPRPAVIDIATGDTSTVDVEELVGFTHDGGWLIARQYGRIVGLRPDGSGEQVLFTGAGSNGIAVFGVSGG